MKKKILSILEWHEDTNGMILNTKFDWITNELNDLFLIKLAETEEKVGEFFLSVIKEEIDKIRINQNDKTL